MVPQLAFVALYSAQPHKEARFIIYAVPPLTAAAALGASYIWTRRARTVVYRLGALALVGGVVVSFVAAMGMLAVSALNYPGGEALWTLRRHVELGGQKGVVRVHMDVLSCMTGVTKFQEEAPIGPLWRSGEAAIWGNAVVPAAKEGGVNWQYDKTEDEAVLGDAGFWEGFDYALMADPAKAVGEWEVIDAIWGFAGVEVLRPGEWLWRLEDGEVWDLARETWEWWVQGWEGRWEVVMEVVVKDGLFREMVRRFVTRGWWVGPRMEKKVHILRRVLPDKLDDNE